MRRYVLMLAFSVVLCAFCSLTFHLLVHRDVPIWWYALLGAGIAVCWEVRA